jgi:hypothetical protein
MSFSRKNDQAGSAPDGSRQRDPICLLRESLSRSAEAVMTLNTAALERATTEQHALLQELRDRYDTGDGDTGSVLINRESNAALAHQLVITSRILLRSRRTLAALQFLTSGDLTSYSSATHTR